MGDNFSLDLRNMKPISVPCPSQHDKRCYSNTHAASLYIRTVLPWVTDVSMLSSFLSMNFLSGIWCSVLLTMLQVFLISLMADTRLNYFIFSNFATQHCSKCVVSLLTVKNITGKKMARVLKQQTCTRVPQRIMPHIFFSRKLFILSVWNSRTV